MLARTSLLMMASLICVTALTKAHVSQAAEERIVVGDRVVTTEMDTPVRQGKEVLLRVAEGSSFVVRAVEREWASIATERDGKSIRGWIEAKYLRFDEPTLPEKFWKLVPIHRKFGPPQPNDWVVSHAEPGQTYLQYVHGRPVRPGKKRGVIYVQPLGRFNQAQRKIVNLAGEFMSIYFGLPVEIQPDLHVEGEDGTWLDEVIPPDARRIHPSWGMEQILTSRVLSKLLRPRLPGDACAYIAFTSSDLWPGPGWNFVFGQASLRDRVGVWSIYRFGKPDKSEEEFRLCLRRTVKTATHETGHMFSMKHCILYQCNMCGSNHLEESDRRPLALCPHCLAKVCWATKTDPEQRFEKLIAFCKANGLQRDQKFYEVSLRELLGQ